MESNRRELLQVMGSVGAANAIAMALVHTHPNKSELRKTLEVCAKANHDTIVDWLSSEPDAEVQRAIVQEAFDRMFTPAFNLCKERGGE